MSTLYPGQPQPFQGQPMQPQQPGQPQPGQPVNAPWLPQPVQPPAYPQPQQPPAPQPQPPAQPAPWPTYPPPAPVGWPQPYPAQPAAPPAAPPQPPAPPAQPMPPTVPPAPQPQPGQPADPRTESLSRMQSALVAAAQQAGLTDPNMLRLVDATRIGITQSGLVIGAVEAIEGLRQYYPQFFARPQAPGMPGQPPAPPLAGGAPAGVQQPALQMSPKDNQLYNSMGWAVLNGQFQLHGAGTPVLTYQDLMMGQTVAQLSLPNMK